MYSRDGTSGGDACFCKICLQLEVVLARRNIHNIIMCYTKVILTWCFPIFTDKKDSCGEKWCNCSLDYAECVKKNMASYDKKKRYMRNKC